MDVSDLSYGFGSHLKELAEHEPELVAEALRLEADERGLDSSAYGRWLAELVVSRARWRRAVGETIDTTELAKLLGCTRQALKDRVNNHRLLAVPGRRSSLYPTWQIDRVRGEVRPAAARWVQAWLDIEPEASPLTLAAIAVAPSDQLAGRSPAELIVDDVDVDQAIAFAETMAWARAR